MSELWTDNPPRADGPDSARAHAHGQGEPLECLDWCPICRTADILRNGSPELQEQWQRIQREMLLVMNAFIEHQLARLDAEDGSAPPP